MASNLKRYKNKRNFSKTPEPAGASPKAREGRSYVIQKHAARRLHYDFRLELEGVLKSWAVPKGPSLDPKERRLAVHVEDHPIEYADFEGTIPKGQYGGGTVMVWDHGSWEPVGDPKKGLRAGRLKFRLYGDKLRGGWSLIRMPPKEDEEDRNDNWLLIKETDEEARPTSEYDITEARGESVQSGRDLEEIARSKGRVWQSDRDGGKKSSKPTATNRKATLKPTPPVDISEIPGARKRAQPEEFMPQLATLTSEVPKGDAWVHEVKFDGYRLLAIVSRKSVRLITRNGNDWTGDMPNVAEAVAALGLGDAILDGEAVVLKKGGTTDFQALQNTIKSGKAAGIVLYVFDLPFYHGYDLTRAPLIERKRVLEHLLSAAGKSSTIRYSDHIVGNGQTVYDQACGYGMEGIISKRADAPYEQRRTRSWLKVKCIKRQEFVIGGYTDPSGARNHFGALLLGYHEDKNLRFCGKVGTGFTEASLKSLMRRLGALAQKTCPFTPPPPRAHARNAHWIAPQLVAEVEFTEWTGDGILRHPSFKGLREDKAANEITREREEPLERAETRPKKESTAVAPKTRVGQKEDTRVAGVDISSPERVLYPEQGITKIELARFYESIADWILPHVANRPLTIVRCPQGREQKCFYQKHLKEGLPDELSGVSIAEKEGEGIYVTLSDVGGLIALVQIGALEIHPWGSRNDDVEKPDRLTIDLDPGPDVEWSRVIEAAFHVRAVLQDVGLESFVKTTGGKGIHVVVPIGRRSGWDEAKAFSEAVSRAVTSSDPSKYVAVMTKAKRKGKIYVDFHRNGRGATAVAAYSTRAREGAPVSTPLRWEELAKGVTAAQFNLHNLEARLRALKKDPWEGFFEVRQSITAKAKKKLDLA